MRKCFKYSLYQWKSFFSQKYVWLLIVVANIFGIYFMLQYDHRLVVTYGTKLPGQVYMLYLIGHWRYIQFGICMLFILAIPAFYQNFNFNRQMYLRLGGRKKMYLGKLLSFAFIAPTFLILITAIPNLACILVGSDVSEWSQLFLHGNQISPSDGLTYALYSNPLFFEAISPTTLVGIHLLFALWALFLYMVLADILKWVFNSLVWSIALLCIFPFSLRGIFMLTESYIIQYLTFRDHISILTKIETSEIYISYTNTILFFVFSSIALLSFSFWKECKTNI